MKQPTRPYFLAPEFIWILPRHLLSFRPRVSIRKSKDVLWRGRNGHCLIRAVKHVPLSSSCSIFRFCHFTAISPFPRSKSCSHCQVTCNGFMALICTISLIIDLAVRSHGWSFQTYTIPRTTARLTLPFLLLPCTCDSRHALQGHNFLSLTRLLNRDTIT